MGFQGILIGAGAFFIIGLMHPVVIKTEYYFGTRAWWAFLIPGLVLIGLSLFPMPVWASALLSILGFSFLWSIHELFEQKRRVEKGWFPKNPKKG